MTAWDRKGRLIVPRRSAFTLVELLVVIGIIIILVGILLPTVMSSRRAADKAAARMDLQTIGLALDAYKADFGDYPRPPVGQPKYRLLAWALIGPYNATTGPNNPFGGGMMTDGADGPGFRTVFSMSGSNQKGGKVWGPYLPPGKFLTSSSNFPDNEKWDIMDRYGTPIEYFPRWRTPRPTMHLFGTDAATAGAAVYDYRQQWLASATSTPSGSLTPNPQTPIPYLRKALGDDSVNDVIDGAEVAKEMPPFILISRGPYQTYSTNFDITTNFAKCDEITNLQH